MRLLRTSAFALLAALAWAPQTTAAQEVEGVEVRPAINEYVVSPGQQTTIDLDVTNLLDEPQAVQVVVEPVAGGEIVNSVERGRYDAKSWLTPEQDGFVLDPGEQRTARVAVAVPDNAPAGGFYAQVGFRILSDASDGAQITPQINSVLLLQVPGEQTERLVFHDEGFRTIRQGQDVRFVVDLANTGSIHVLPAINIELSRGDDRIQLPVRSQLVLPNTSQQFEALWQPPDGFQSYTATTTVTYGTPAQVISRQAQFKSAVSVFQLTLFAVFTYILVRLWRGRGRPGSHSSGDSASSKSSRQASKQLGSTKKQPPAKQKKTIAKKSTK